MVHRRALLIVLAAVYFLALCYSYRHVESVAFIWQNFYFEPPPWTFRMLSFALGVAPAFWLPVGLKRPSQACMWILYVMVYMPAMIVPYHVINAAPSQVVLLPLSLAAMMFLLGMLMRRQPLKIGTSGINPSLVFTALLGLALVLVPMVLVTSGSFSINLSLADVYERRLNARDLVSPRSLLAYGIQMLSYSVAPILLIIGFLRRHWLALGLGLLGLLSVYSLRATKSELFMPMFLLAVTFLVTKFRGEFGIAALMGATTVVSLSIFAYLGLGRLEVSDYLVRRMLMVPAQLTSYYWEYFSGSRHVYYSDGFLRNVLQPAYQESTARLIGYVYMGSPDAHANANLWATSFAQMGYLGMFVTTCVLSLVLRFIDGLVEHGNFALVAVMSTLFALGWANGALETSMLSGGVAGSLLILYFLRSPDGNLGFMQVPKKKPQSRPEAVPAPQPSPAAGLRGPHARPAAAPVNSRVAARRSL